MLDLATAQNVLVASYSFDHVGVFDCLCRLLRKRPRPSVRLVVDEELFGARTTRGQRSKLHDLRELGAAVYLGGGSTPLGSLHAKGVVINKRVAFFGSANLTQKSLQNAELTFRATGPPVADVTASLEAAVQRAKLWDGIS